VSDLESLITEARRQLTICDSCRYCEGYCPTFPALERGGLSNGDVVFLANLCHDCRACLQACMYAPPHEFAVTVPTSLSAVRDAGYSSLVWPPALSRAVEHPVITKSVALIIGLVLAVSGLVIHGSGVFATYRGPGSFYRVIPSALLTGFFLGLSALALAIIVGGLIRFWGVTRNARTSAISWKAVVRAVWSALVLRNLTGGGEGCYYPDPERPSRARRILHEALVFGLAAAFAATVAAAVEQHILGNLPPYPFLSAPVVLGCAGGVAIIAGGGGLAVLRSRSQTSQPILAQVQSYALIASLELVAVSGLLLLFLRSSAAMATLLLVHLAAVIGLFLTLPIDKFVHAVHRVAALVLDAAER
jgi:citrate/tricarballylate utilization protein